jgi:hypothetical protein
MPCTTYHALLWRQRICWCTPVPAALCLARLGHSGSSGVMLASWGGGCLLARHAPAQCLAPIIHAPSASHAAGAALTNSLAVLLSFRHWGQRQASEADVVAAGNEVPLFGVTLCSSCARAGGVCAVLSTTRTRVHALGGVGSRCCLVEHPHLGKPPLAVSDQH